MPALGPIAPLREGAVSTLSGPTGFPDSGRCGGPERTLTKPSAARMIAFSVHDASVIQIATGVIRRATKWQQKRIRCGIGTFGLALVRRRRGRELLSERNG